jgi:Tfp pilus assembly protein PilF
VISSYLEGFHSCNKAGLEEARAQVPKDSSIAGDADYLEALKYMEEQKYAEAEQAFRNAATKGCTRQYHAVAMCAVFYGLRGNLPEAIKEFMRALELKPDHPQILVMRGATLLQLGDVPAAMAQFDNALAIDDQCADAYYNRYVI